MSSREERGEYHGCITPALLELLRLQNEIQHSQVPYFGKLLARLVGVDTIPILLITKDGFLELEGTEKNNKISFKTRFFRIEEVDGDCVKVSLLRAFDIYGEETNVLCVVAKLRKTDYCVDIDISCICAIQCMDINLLKREFIIEPKW